MNSSCHGKVPIGSVTLWGNNIDSVPQHRRRRAALPRRLIRAECDSKRSASHRFGATGRNATAKSGRTTCAQRRDEQRPSRTQVARRPVHTVSLSACSARKAWRAGVFLATKVLDCARTLQWTPTGGAVHSCMPASVAPISGACRFVRATLRQRPRLGSPLASDAKAALGRAYSVQLNSLLNVV